MRAVTKQNTYFHTEIVMRFYIKYIFKYYNLIKKNLERTKLITYKITLRYAIKLI